MSPVTVGIKLTEIFVWGYTGDEHRVWVYSDARVVFASSTFKHDAPNQDQEQEQINPKLLFDRDVRWPGLFVMKGSDARAGWFPC
ncbi:hypothetical protein evm_005315 [Chilo suppressalis]|nr:hypothetical protein evm_005315 [Chilo suppressalis]